MKMSVPKCRTLTVHAFQGDRGAIAKRVRKALDDEFSQVFVEAKKRKLSIFSIDVMLPGSAVLTFEQLLSAERAESAYTYGFPNGDGDCNCITWLERLSLPLLSGSMDELTGLLGFSPYPKRRFGRCVERGRQK